MELKYADYMRLGKDVRDDSTGIVYYIIADTDKNAGEVRAVNKRDNLRRYNLLRAWLSNGVAEKEGKTEEYEAEKASLVETLPLSRITPANIVRFITPNYETRFEVPDLGMVEVNGETRMVDWIDDYHFRFINPGTGRWCSCYHICEFAEISKMHNMSVWKAS